MRLYYELTENGYYIKDKDNYLFNLHQYEPYIPYRENESDKDYKACAQRHIEAIEKANADIKTLAEVQADVEVLKEESAAAKQINDEQDLMLSEIFMM